jgi:hypothetical protein
VLGKDEEASPDEPRVGAEGAALLDADIMDGTEEVEVAEVVEEDEMEEEVGEVEVLEIPPMPCKRLEEDYMAHQ